MNLFKNTIKKSLRRANKNTQGYHVSIDVDVLNAKQFPGASTPVKGGITKKQALKIQGIFIETGSIPSVDFDKITQKNQ